MSALESAPTTFDWKGELNEESILVELPRLLRDFLPGYLPNQRWYGEKTQTITSIELDQPDVAVESGVYLALSVATLGLSTGSTFRYFVPFAIEPGESDRTLVRIDTAGQTWSLVTAQASDAFHHWLWNGIAAGGAGTERFRWHVASDDFQAHSKPDSRVLSGEQSNTNIAYSDAVLIKVFRRVQLGLNPDVELGTYLTRDAGLLTVPRVIGDLRMSTSAGEEASIGIAQRFLGGSTDGWSWLGEKLIPAGTDGQLRLNIQYAIRSLGGVTADIHVALASATDPEIAPEPVGDDDISSWKSQTAAAVEAILIRVAGRISSIEFEDARAQAEALVTFGDQLRGSMSGYDLLAGQLKTRVHGDYHLGQTLRRGDDWFVLDFEGEPARPLSERRARYSPLKDVAGMLRSLGYARAFATQHESAWTDPARTLERIFIEGYRERLSQSPLAPQLMPLDDDTFATALRPWIIDKAIYEIAYELDNRPSWLWVPIMSLFAAEP